MKAWGILARETLCDALRLFASWRETASRKGAKTQSHAKILAQQRPRVLHDILDIEAEVLESYVTRRGRAKAIQANLVSLESNITIPALAN